VDAAVSLFSLFWRETVFSRVNLSVVLVFTVYGVFGSTGVDRQPSSFTHYPTVQQQSKKMRQFNQHSSVHSPQSQSAAVENEP